MNKKGFTLVEIIAVIVLLVTIGGIFTVSMVRKLNDKENNKDTVKQIISAADAYVSANKEEIEKLYEGYNFVDITIKDLKNNGLLNDDIIDPNTNEKYSDDEKVRITLNGSTGAVEFTISPEEKDNTYLIADDIYLKHDANNTNWCDNDNNVFMGLNSSDKNASRLVLVNASKANETYTLVKNDTIVKKECNVNATKAGNYEIKYEYTYNGSTVSKTRNVHVSSNDKDIESFTAIINENHNKLFLDASKEETNITLNITYRNGTKVPKETTIAKLADIDVPAGTKVLMAEENGAGLDHPFAGEKLSPVSGVQKAKDLDDAIDKMMACLNYQGKGHSCGIHTNDDEDVARVASVAPVTKCVVNQPQCLTNSGGWNCGFPVSMTLGCGTWGGNSVSHNATYKDLLNFTYVSRQIPNWKPEKAEDFIDAAVIAKVDA